jgi:branched-subunit amino acid transport protein
MSIWLTVLAAGFGSFLFRVSMVAVADRVLLPATLERGTELVAPAAFAALAATAVAGAATGVALTEAIAPLAAVAIAALAVLRTGSSHAAILAGMPTLWLLNAALPG